MKTQIVSFAITALALLGSPVASAEPKPQLKVITASPEGFGVTSTLITGEKDAILIDADFTLSDAHRVVAAILESKKNLTTVYITHFHPDHYFGLTAVKQAFPKARIVALPSTIADIKKTAEEKVKTWKPMYGDNLTAKPVIPEPLKGNALTLEGETFQVFGEVQGDEANNSYVWIPSLKAVVAGDIVYSGVYLWTRDSTPADRKEWIKTLDKIASLNPSVVVAGHKTPELKDDASSIEFTRAYLTAYDEALASSKSAEELRSKVKSKFPNLGLEIILQLASERDFSSKK
jgi:glyoxylase-like metal-dependent hydrolase (beta-lactamase superfamily II)